MNRTLLPDLNTLPLAALFDELVRNGHAKRLLELARDEDLGEGDITSECSIGAHEIARATLRAREAGVVAGLAALPLLLPLFAPACTASCQQADGAPIERQEPLATLVGPARQLLALERTMLNLLSRLSGVATTTARFVDAMDAEPRALPARLYDTRKTSPGMRALEKYAVRCGGGRCHRIGLFDAVLLKDNHLAHVPDAELPAYVRRASEAARALRPLRFVEVEVDRLEQFERLLSLPHGAIDIVLLDNMPCEMLSAAVDRRRRAGAAVELEASGGINLRTVRDVAATGIDRISCGALTHSAVSLDLGLDFE